MKLAVAALLMSSANAAMSPEDTEKCNAAIEEAERVKELAHNTKKAELIALGFGIPDFVKAEKSDCFKQVLSAWTDVRDANREATLDACLAKVKTAKDPTPCFVMPEKADTGEGCSGTTGKDGASRRICENPKECCGGMRLKESDTTNTGGEFCFAKKTSDITAMDAPNSFLFGWFDNTFVQDIKDRAAGAASKESYAAFMSRETTNARSSAFM